MKRSDLFSTHATRHLQQIDAARAKKESTVPIYRFGDKQPQMGGNVWIAHGAQVIGDVRLGDEVSIWFNAVLRGDNDPITIGAGSNIQDGCVLHTDAGVPLHIGARATIGHCAVLHGCIVGDESLVGIGATVLNGAVIGKHCLVGAGALVTEGKTFADGSLIMGSPARAVRQLTVQQIAALQQSALRYVEKARRYRESLQAI